MADQVTSTDLIIKLPAVMTAEAFTDDREFEKLFAKVQEEVSKHTPDVSTTVGRQAIASLAYKVARTKTALVGQGKKLTESWRDQTKKVNAACNTIEERLDALKDSVRKPLTEWEVAEAERVDGHKACLEALINLSKVGFGRPSSELRELLADVQNQPMGKEHWEEFAPQASVAREDAIDTLTRLLATAEKQEREAAELEQLRAEKAERDRQEAERLAAEEAKQAEADRVERERIAEEKRKADLEKAAAEAAERVERENAARVAAAEQAAKDAADRAKREAEDAQRRADEAIAAAKVQAEREAAAERKRIADAQEAEAAEQRRREANIAHRKTINNSIVKELVKCSGITADQAQKIVVHLVSGLVPNVTLKY
ncbi:hypothetical protein HGP14_09425 [Rhizobium sp. P32RR-XVIII]|uniref:hypothetical protein n=1 Tax=Rhizobium sp. P32RR-XVIII TaxID=2726738 RepID=UPI00145794B1|nr:hypothetical protein [Rhizobium sp. P32RR-XVIII]NLS03577.1 hypothetical protein [Rhizobium sp. P32RR-XVIII]